MLIGLTGGYCAGKNVVAGILERRGWACLDLDALGHEAIDLARDAVAARFGAAAMRPDGSVDRKAVARIVFADPVALADQEAIVHPIVYGMVEERLAAARESGRDACLNGALLYRTPLAGRCELMITSDEYLEFIPPGADKGHALADLAGRLGLRPAQVAAAGDGWNDLGMLRWAGTRIAVASGREDLKAVATAVVPGPEQDGLAAWIEAQLLSGSLAGEDARG